MRTLFLLIWLFLSPGDSLSILCWNVENFFDWRNDSTTVSDGEFSAGGERRWSWKRFQAKANAFAKALLWVEQETGRPPDIIGLEEVENAFVLRQLLQKTALRKLDYKYVHFDSPDRRGIDVALLYRSSRLELLDSKPCHLYARDTVMTTRDILLCVFQRDSTVFAVLVNHHPSKYGGVAESEPRRRIAVERLRFLADSLAALGIDRIVAGGDFNDTPDNPVFRLLEPALLPKHLGLQRRGLGTIKYDGKWDLIDHFYVSPALAPYSGMRILRIPFLLARDTAHSGEKPLRTYTGPRHVGGVSDHLPILLEVGLSIENNLYL
ncbi:MAG: endonuclease/exonuclease/phosphatase family protein [Bacteroidales bacterium]|nr:endonuclease/exonuclease/phosphatase family protein [Bacteroidales bacterium]